MRGMARVVMLGAVVTTTPFLGNLSPVLGAALTVLSVVVLAVALSGAATPISVGLGALGALAFSALAPLSVAFAGGVLIASAYGERTLRARTFVWQVLMATTAFLAGGVAMWIAWAWAEYDLTMRVAALCVAALVAASPLLFTVDDRVAWRLRHLASRAAGPLRMRLLRAVVLRRRYEGASFSLSRPAHKRVTRAFRSLTGAASARIDASGPATVLDRRVTAYVTALGRACRAAERAHALSTGIDDAVLPELELDKEDLEARAEALAEMG